MAHRQGLDDGGQRAGIGGQRAGPFLQQRDPGRVRLSDLRKTEQDPLLARTRRLLRQEYGFPGNPKRRFNVPCVWSDEPQQAPRGHCAADTEGSLNCAGYGACMPVTATFGLVAAGHVVQQISSG